MRLTEEQKIALQGGAPATLIEQHDNPINSLFDIDDLNDLIGDLESDQQSVDLLGKVYAYFHDKFKLTSSEEDALSRVRGALHHRKGWDKGTHRNNIFKAANSLGMKLPSSMF